MKTTELKKVSTVGKKVNIKESIKYEVNRGIKCSNLLERLEEDFLDGLEESNNINFGTDYFDFETNTLLNCCGVVEIGAINLSKNFPEKDVLTILEYLLSIYTKDNGKSYTFIINTNGKNDCVRFEQILAKCKYFTLVKTFTNINSGSTIKMWISKN
jgi:hypothetical protein